MKKEIDKWKQFNYTQSVQNIHCSELSIKSIEHNKGSSRSFKRNTLLSFSVKYVRKTFVGFGNLFKSDLFMGKMCGYSKLWKLHMNRELAVK